MSASERAEKRLRAQADLRAAVIDRWMRATLADPDGRAFLWWLYSEVAQGEALPWAPAQSKAEMAFHEGRRHVALRVRDLAKRASHEGWLLMLREHDGPARPQQRPPEDEEGEEGEEGEEA